MAFNFENVDLEQKAELRQKDTRVTPQEFGLMRTAYMNNPIKVEQPDGTEEVVKGFRIPVTKIREIIDRADCEVTDLFIVFGAKPGTKNPGKNYLTTILSGITEDVSDPVNPDGELKDDILHDYCEPCPSRCPSGF